MNKRIRELAFKAECKFKKFNKGAAMYQNVESELENFAEIIILECMEVSLKNSHRDDDMGAIIARQIKQHFGVEQ